MASATLKGRGWHLSDDGIEQCTQNGRADADSLIRVALDTDLREISNGWLPDDVNRGKADYVEGPGVLQLQKIRNVSAPKDNEESQFAPRLMKLQLTDGQTTCSAIETEVLTDIGSNTPPGSKIKLRMTVDVEHGFLLLNNKNIQYLGGRVSKLAEGWELKKKLAKQQRATFATDGGPPPFVPFGQKIDNSQYKTPQRRDNFKSLESTKIEKKPEDDEFEQQRKAIIAEALQAKEDSSSKTFGGQKKVSDHNVAKIMEMGFRAEEATSALKMNNGNLQQAIDDLLNNRRGGFGAGRGQGGPNRQSSYEGDRGRGRRDRRDEDAGPGRGRRGRDGEETGDGSKPSGPATLFDFLETKMPAGEKKAFKKDEKSAANDSQPSYSKPSYDKYSSQSYQTDSRDRPQTAHTTSDTQNQFNRPKPQQNIPPRFVNKSKQDGVQGQSKSRFTDDRTERSWDDRPKTDSNEKRNSENRNYNDRNFNDRDRNKNYNDGKGYNNERNDKKSYSNDQGDRKGYSNDRGDRRGYNNDRGDRRGYNNDQGEGRGYNSDYGERKYNNDRGDRRGYNNEQGVGRDRGSRDKDSNSKQSFTNNRNNSEYSQRNNGSNSSKSSANNKKEVQDNTCSKDSRNNQEPSQGNTKLKDSQTSNNNPAQGQSKSQSRGNGAQNKSQSFQRNENSKPEYNSQNSNNKQDSRTKGSNYNQESYTKGGNNSQDSYSRGGKGQQQSHYRNERSQTNSQNYGANGNYGNQQQRSGNYNNNQQMNVERQINSGHFQQPEFIYAEQQPCQINLKCGDKVMAKYWEDGMYYESVIEVVAPNLPTCVVHFLDYGNSEEVFLTDIRPCIPQMLLKAVVNTITVHALRRCKEHSSETIAVKMTPPGAQLMQQPDLSVPPPQVFFSGPPPTMQTGMEEMIQGIGSMEFRRGGGGAAYTRKEGRPPQQLYQPPGQRR